MTPLREGWSKVPTALASRYIKPKALSLGTSREINLPLGLRAFLQTSKASVRSSI